MINIGKILKRAWYILWNYRVLWIFGILLALTTGGGGGNGGGGSSRTSQTDTRGYMGGIPENAPGWMHDLSNWFTQNIVPMFTHPGQYVSTFVTIGIIVFLVILILCLLTALVRYPTETAVIRMVDEYETTGTKVTFRQGWKLGWNRRAFRLWLIDLLLSIPVIVFVLLILGAGLIVYASVSSTFQIINVAGVVGATGLAFLALFLMLVTAVVLGLLRNFFIRAAALENMGVWESIRYGWGLFKRNWKSGGLMWLVMIGIGIVFGIAAVVAFFLCIPLYLILLVPAGLVAGLPGLIAYGITSLFAGSPVTWIVALLVAIPFFFMVLFAPLVLLSGWFKIYESNVWTLTYREILALENHTPAVTPVEDKPVTA
ncbi:MAG: hypothetical protein GYA15_00875 [Leptolinea sp.]|jgi:hypothetical protein|nr:hypothetical protein [Leptolinea sp.]